MRLYLCSYGFGNQPTELLSLLKGKRVGVIANALDHQTKQKRTERLNRELDGLIELGLEPTEIDLRNYFDDNIKLAEEVKGYDFIWVRGGNVFILRKAYKQSGFDAIITDLLSNDTIAYGGYSAGICVLTPTLKGLEIVDPVNQEAERYQMDTIWDGLSILDYAFAPHYKSDHPESEDIDRYVNYLEVNKIAYKALRDGEAIVVDGTTERLLNI